jgi:hypothetical protein
MIISLELALAFAARIAPRRLQSFGAAVHAIATAESSVRSTMKVIVAASLETA